MTKIYFDDPRIYKNSFRVEYIRPNAMYKGKWIRDNAWVHFDHYLKGELLSCEMKNDHFVHSRGPKDFGDNEFNRQSTIIPTLYEYQKACAFQMKKFKSKPKIIVRIDA